MQLGALQVVLLSTLIASMGNSQQADIQVWTENSLVKVKPEDLPRTGSSDVYISAAQNEFESFQIIIRGSGSPLRGVDVDMSDFRAGGRSRISCQDNCTLYREDYITVTQPSGQYGSVGEWPDTLIPSIDRYEGEKRNAFPIDVALNRNLPIWVDVHVPVGTAPGLYTAYVYVRMEGNPTVRIPVYLTVWNFALPTTSSIKNAFLLYADALPSRHRSLVTREALDQLARTYSKALLTHRLTNGWLVGDGWGWQPKELDEPTSASLEELMRVWGPFFDGSILDNGAQVTSYIPWFEGCLYGSLCRPDVLDLFAKSGWINRMAIYLPDEPNLANATIVQQLTETANSIHQKDRRLRTLLTHSYSELMQSQTDIWVVPLQELQESIDNGSYWSTYGQESAQGKEIWVYQSCAMREARCSGQSVWFPGLSGWPDYMIDMQGMKNRIQDWVNWKFHIQGELYWGVNYRYYDADPYQDQFAFWGNGEGTFFYPGTPNLIGGTTDIPVESIRLKIKRDGLEDYEYLTILSGLGGTAFADTKVGELVRSANDWETNPALLFRLRQELAAQIEALKSVGLTPVPSSKAKVAVPNTRFRPSF